MRRNMVTIVYGLVVTLLLSTPHLVVASQVRYTAEFSQFDIGFGTLDEYDIVHMRGTQVMSDLGKPVLPAKTIGIAIPKGTEAVRVEARSRSTVVLPGSFYVLPGQPPQPIGTWDVQLTEKPDPVVYNSTSAYPEELTVFEHQSNLAGQQIVWVTIFPLQYVPRDRQLILHERVEVTVHCERAVNNSYEEQYYNFTDRQRSLYEEMIKDIVVNPQAVMVNPTRRGPSFVVPPGSFDHVIVTSSAFASSFESLVEWHTKKGLRDTVVTTEWIYANYPGPGDTLQIRQFVEDANTSWGTMYFLMAGEDDIVPFCWRYYTGDYPDQIAPSDQYYSDFDDDWTHEVYVGRISIDNETQINTFVDKVLKYEKDPPLTDYPLDVLLVAMDLDASSPGEVCKERIDDDYIAGYFNVNKVYDSHGGDHHDSTMVFLNAGQNIVNHIDHSNQTTMGFIGIGDVSALTNDGQMSTIVSTGCEPNAMDYEDCVAEQFVIYNPNQAGIAFIGDTRHGWYYIGNACGLTGELDEWWCEGVFQQNKEDQGQALIYSKHQFNHTGSTRMHCEWNWCLLGEPAMPIWTNTPDVLEVTHVPVVGAEPHVFQVTVKDNDGVTPIEDALVCCWVRRQNPTMHVTEYTNASGIANLSISPNMPGDTMFVTVTKRNYLPYEGFTWITAASGPYVIAGSMIIDDYRGDGLVNPGETVDLGVYGFNIGFDPASSVYGLLIEFDPYVTLSAASSWYGSIASYDSVLSYTDYTFDVANDCPNGHVIEFVLDFHDINDSLWRSHPEIRVYAPDLTYQDHAVVGGKWDNGMLDPGETADLCINLRNEGDATAEDVTATLITSAPNITIDDAAGSFGSVEPDSIAINSGDPFTVTTANEIPFGTPVDFSVIIESGVYLDTIDFSLVVGQLPPTDSGYYYAYYSHGPYLQAPIFSWFAIDSTQGTYPGVSLDLDRNETVVIDLPFTFRYYGVDYSQISICSNGWIALGSTSSTDFSNTGIPNTDGPPAMIAAMWDYLHPGVPGGPGDIYYYYDATNHRFVVEYFRVEHYPSGDPETFEVMFNDPVYYSTPTGDGEIIVQYLLEMQKPGGSTIGIENVSQDLGIEYYFNGDYHSLAVPITNSFAIKYATYAPSPGAEEYSGTHIIPTQTLLSAVYPNPFSRAITIQYQLSQSSAVDLKIYDISGRLVRTLEDGISAPGYFSALWDAKDDIGRHVPAGIYFVRFETDAYSKVKKAVLLR
jgi:hypothetical protein